MCENPQNKIFNFQFALTKAIIVVFFVSLILASIWFFSKNNMMAGFAMLILPIPLLFLYQSFKSPRFVFITALFANYFAVGLSRYIPAPTGLLVDSMLLLTAISIVFSQFNQTINWANAARDYSYFVIAWFIMALFQLINPEAVSREAWFYAMRGQAFYLFLTIPIVYLIYNKPNDLDLFIKLCAWFTILAVLKGMQQKYLGVDNWEKAWLTQPGNWSTHMLMGKLRVFSFYSDAGTFGSSMGFFGVVFSILGIYEKNRKTKYFYFLVGFMSLFAMLISGTRSAIAVPLMGFMVYTGLSKQVKIIITMGVLVFLIFYFFKFTTIGQGNYDIKRMRSAFNSEDASLNVRKENRKLFAEYLETRPFGGGIGSSGNWGMRFTPGTFLAETATDGWYVQLWAEHGIVGLSFYLLMILYFFLKSCFLIFFRLKKPENISKAIAFTSGMAGLIVSSYSASSLGQMPNTVVVATAVVFISLMPEWERKELDIVDSKV